MNKLTCHDSLAYSLLILFCSNSGLLLVRKKMSLPNVQNSEFHEGLVPLDGEVAELTLLVPCWQAADLEKAAGTQGITAGQLLRRILQQVISTSQPRVVA